MRKLWSFLGVSFAVLALYSCSEETEDTPELPPVEENYTCQYEIDFAKDVLSYADVAIAVKNPLTHETHRDTLRSAVLSGGDFYSVEEYQKDGKTFVNCRMSWSGVPGSVTYGVYCNYLLNDEKVAALASGTLLQYKAAGLSVRCLSGGTSLFYMGSSGSIGSAAIETIVRQYRLDPDRFAKSYEGTFPEE